MSQLFFYSKYKLSKQFMKLESNLLILIYKTHFLQLNIFSMEPKMEIWLDNQTNTYDPGQKFCGLLKLSLKLERKIRGKSHGMRFNHWAWVKLREKLDWVELRRAEFHCFLPMKIIFMNLFELGIKSLELMNYNLKEFQFDSMVWPTQLGTNVTIMSILTIQTNMKSTVILKFILIKINIWLAQMKNQK